MRKYTFLFFFFVNIALGFSQESDFRHYTVNEGLSQSVINCIYQDSKDFLWFGTQNGLNRFDGYDFKIYTYNSYDTTSIGDVWIYSIDEDITGNLWIGTQNGLQLLDRKTEKFNRISETNPSIQLPDKIVYAVLADSKNNVWMNTPPYLSRYNYKEKTFHSYKYGDFTSESINSYTYPLFSDKAGIIWIASDHGLYSFNPQNEKITAYTNNPVDPNSISNNYVTAILEDRYGNLWVGTRNGLNKSDMGKKRFIKFALGNNIDINDNFIRSIFEDRHGFLWVGTEHEGLYKCKFLSETQELIVIDRFYNMENNDLSISNDFVLSMSEDHSDILWVGTLNGINVLDTKQKKFKLYRKSETRNSVNIRDNIIASIFKDSDGKIWVGNWGKGLTIFDRNLNEVVQYSRDFSDKYNICNDYVHVIFKDNKGRIWIGTRSGIMIYNSDNQSFTSLNDFFKTDKFPDFNNNRVYSIIQDGKDQIWIGTQEGLYIIDTENLTTKYINKSTQPNFISDNLIYELAKDRDNEIWIATNSGLDKYIPSENKIIHYTHSPKQKNTLCDNYVISLCVDHNNDIWIGTKSGLNKFNKATSEFTYYTEKSNLTNTIVYDIVEDENFDIWFTTGRGLVKLQPQNKEFTVYGTENGLQSLEFNKNAKFKSPDGEIFFGGMNGFNSFYPDSLNFNRYVPPIEITSISYYDKDGNQVVIENAPEEIILNYNDYGVEIKFAALEFSDPEQNQYAYKTEGLSDEWIKLGNRNFVSYPDIPPGDYVFQVIGSNSDKIWNKEGRILRIIVKPPWWKTRIAYAGYIIAVLVLILLIIRFREKRLIQEKNILERKVAERTKEIATKNEILINQQDEIKAQNEEILAQKDHVVQQRDQIIKQKKNITDSIYYAQRIQNAMLQSNSSLQEVFNDHFIFFRPKDIISGDFYWVKHIDQYLIIAIADCTGHGVPGAMLSMLGFALLNEITRRKDVSQANQVLEEMKKEIMNSLNQKGVQSEQKDGMDMALCIIDLKTKTLQFAGANNPLILIRDNAVEIFKGDSQPIGVSLADTTFKNYRVNIQQGDRIYMYTDGYYDQFGEKSGKKFYSKNLHQLLSEIHDKPMTEQKEIIEKTISDWQGTQFQYDDMTVFGLHIDFTRKNN